MNRGLVSDFDQLRSANQIKFNEEYMMRKKKYVLIENVFTNEKT